jgi:hypothetical protein
MVGQIIEGSNQGLENMTERVGHKDSCSNIGKETCKHFHPTSDTK